MFRDCLNLLAGCFRCRAKELDVDRLLEFSELRSSTSLVLWLVGATCPQFPSGSDAALCQSVLADQAGATATAAGEWAGRFLDANSVWRQNQKSRSGTWASGRGNSSLGAVNRAKEYVNGSWWCLTPELRWGKFPGESHIWIAKSIQSFRLILAEATA